ncbi:MAG: hypothetical protein HYW02_04555 [Deltaproteobacteria bacterium]|nr:hypothetical protein [Deltaproteobacteria bacterium]
MRQEMLAGMASVLSGADGEKLFRFAAPKEEEPLRRLFQRYLRNPVDREALRLKLENWERFGKRMALEEIHPGWILEKLRGESPRLLSLLPHFLSSSKTEALLHQLNFEERQFISEPARDLSPGLLAVVRSLIEKKIGEPAVLKSDEPFSFDHLSCLRSGDLQALFKDLGQEEFCRAFAHVDGQIQRAVLTRFSLGDVREIRRRLKASESVTTEKRRQAQRHILSLSFGEVSPDHLLRDIGFSVFVRAVSLDKIDWADSLCQKLSVTDGYGLKRLLQEKRMKGEEGSKELCDEIMGRLYVLATQGKIQRYWKEEREIEPTVFLQEERI